MRIYVKNLHFKTSFFVAALSLMYSTSFVQSSLAKEPSGFSTLEIINEVEKNLLYLEGSETIKTKKKINIDKDQWEGGDYKIFKETSEQQKVSVEEKETKEETKIEKAKKRITQEKIKEMQREAYEAARIGHLEVAVEIYKEILKIEPENTYALFGQAAAYHEMGQYMVAKKMYMKVLKIAPGNQRAIGNLLAIVTEESPMESAYFLSDIADRNPQSSYLMAQASVANSNINNYEKAIEYLVRAISVEPNNLEYKLNLAVLVDKKGDHKGAYNLYKELIDTVKMRGSSYNIPMKQIKRRMKFIKKNLLK